MRLRDPADLEDDQTLAEGLRGLPENLYRITGVSGERLSWLRDLVLDSKLYFASPAEFNDPFDSKHPVSHVAPAVDIDRYWRRAARRMHRGVPMHTLKKTVKALVAESRMPAGRARLATSLFASLEQNGSVCLSPSIRNPLMWAHYGEGHRGVAICFRTSRENLGSIRPGGILPIKMRYQSELPEVNFYYGTTAELITTVLGTKAMEWAYEEEWRLVLPGTRGIVQVPSAMVDGIVLGMRLDPAVEHLIREWVNMRSHPLKLFCVTNVPGTFDLTVVPV